MAWPKGKKRVQTAETKKKISNYLKRYYSDSKVRGKKRERLRVPAYRKKMKKLMKKYYKEHPEMVKKIDRIITDWWKEHPNARKQIRIKSRKLFMEHPEKFRRFLSYGKNPALPRFKTKQRFIVKSRGEQEIANFLYEKKIKSLYETKTLFFEKEGMICVPDFYLPKYKTYIEFYGGHPLAWKKKVMKNKLYRKYKIPCIFITPAELRNLERYLKRELESRV